MAICTGREELCCRHLVGFFGGSWKKLLDDVLIGVSIAVKTKMTTHQVNSNGSCIHLCGGAVCGWVYVCGYTHVYMHVYEVL